MKFEEFVKHVKIEHPIRGIIPFNLWPHQIRLAKAYEDNKFVIFSKPRQMGISTLNRIWALWRAMFFENQHILFGLNADRMVRYEARGLDICIANLPDELKPKLIKRNDHEVQFANGNHLWFYTPEPARGKACSHIIIDEAAFHSDIERSWKCFYPCIGEKGKCVVGSTPSFNGAVGHNSAKWFNNTLTKARNLENQFYPFEMHYQECPDYASFEWIRIVHANLGRNWWSEVQQVPPPNDVTGSGEDYFPVASLT